MTCKMCDTCALGTKGDIMGYDSDGGCLRLAVGANDKILMADSVQATGFKWADAPDAASYPQRTRQIWHHNCTVVSGNALNRWSTSNQYYGFLTQQAAPYSDGDSWTQSFEAEAGSYTIEVVGMSWSDRGILEIFIDDVSQGTQDWYSGGAGYNASKTTSITVVGDGYHKLTGTINGKNGSSSSYDMYLSYYRIYPASD